MEKFEILQELPKWKTETQREQVLLEKNGSDRLLIQGCHKLSICSKKKKRTTKYIYVEYNKMPVLRKLVLK